MQIKESSVARVFFCLWPESSVSQALHALAMEYQPKCEARVMHADTLHMTLLFVGGVERVSLPQLMQAAGKVSASAFGFALERLSFWQHNRIGFVASATEVPALHQLVMVLQQELLGAGFPFDQRAFSPHVTLLRNVRHALESQTITPIMWRAEAFVLVESGHD